MDNLDMQILSRLLNNCRESDRQIGMELGVSGGAVRVRIQKMEEAGIIEKFFVKIEPPVLGYSILYIVVSGQNVDEILKQIGLIGSPYFVVPCIGRITVCSIVVREELDQKIDLAERLMRDVRVLSIFEAKSPGYSLNLTKTDLDILQEMIKDPRQKNKGIAKSTGMSTKTVTRCIEKLQRNEGIRFSLIYNPKKIEGFIPHVILTWITGDLKKTLKSLNSSFSESYMQAPFVSKDQIVLFMYSESIFEMDGLVQKVGAKKNIKTVDLFIPKKLLFYSKWIERAIRDSEKFPKLHLRYQPIK